jgi:hypothetical protein
MSKSVFQVLIADCQQQQERVKEAMSKGTLSSYEEYKESCGSIRGLEYAIRTIEDLSRNYEDSDNE